MHSHKLTKNWVPSETRSESDVTIAFFESTQSIFSDLDLFILLSDGNYKKTPHFRNIGHKIVNLLYLHSNPIFIFRIYRQMMHLQKCFFFLHSKDNKSLFFWSHCFFFLYSENDKFLLLWRHILKNMPLHHIFF